jgi:hypothetical protein
VITVPAATVSASVCASLTACGRESDQAEHQRTDPTAGSPIASMIAARVLLPGSPGQKRETTIAKSPSKKCSRFTAAISSAPATRDRAQHQCAGRQAGPVDDYPLARLPNRRKQSQIRANLAAPRSIRCASQRSRPPVTRGEGQKLSSRVALEVLLVFVLRIKRRAANQIRNLRRDQPLIGDRRSARMRHHLQEARAQLKPTARIQCSA